MMIRPASALALLLSTSLAATPALAQTTQTTSVSAYAIPAGPLTAALNRLAEASGLQISYEAGLTERLATSGVEGRMSAEQALSQLLKGTGLSWRWLDGRTITVVRASRAALASR